MKKYAYLLIPLIMTLLIACNSKNQAEARKFNILLEEAQMSITKKEFTVAAEKLEAAIEIRPDQDFVVNNLAVLYAQRLNNPEKAKELWLGLLEKEPNNSAYINNLAGIYLSQNEYDEAMELYEKAKVHATQYHLPYYNIAKLYMQKEDYDKAEREIKAGLKYVKDDSVYFVTYAYLLVKNDKLMEARQFLESKYSQKNGSITYAIPLIHLYRRLDQMDDAWKVINEALKVNPFASQLLVEKIEILWGQKEVSDENKQEIEEPLKKLSEIPPKPSIEFYVDLYKLREEILANYSDEAFQELKKLDFELEEDTTYLKAIQLHLLGRLHSRQGNPEAAFQAFKRAVELDPFLYEEPSSAADMDGNI